MKRLALIGTLLLTLTTILVAMDSAKEKERVTESGNVMKEIMATPDKGIPGSVLDGSKCVIVLPSVKKGAIGIGAVMAAGS